MNARGDQAMPTATATTELLADALRVLVLNPKLAAIIRAVDLKAFEQASEALAELERIAMPIDQLREHLADRDPQAGHLFDSAFVAEEAPTRLRRRHRDEHARYAIPHPHTPEELA
jgi:hypothetical protein